MEILNTANSFYIASQRCFEPKKKNDKEMEILMVPGIVNISFATELYLKYLIEKQGKTIKGHKLLDLFNCLNKETREIIQNEYSKKQSEKKDYWNRVNLPDEYKLLKSMFPEITSTNYIEDLKKFSDAFTNWRYIHENPNFNATVASDFFYYTCDIIRNKLL